jgi:diguanylate cyclase (GGDEF)-like protein
MKNEEKELIRKLSLRLFRLLEGETAPERVVAGGTDPCLADLVDAVEAVAGSLVEAQAFFMALADGNLDQDPPPHNQLIAPFKRLHSHLRHLTWQTQQIAAGDLNQRVEFLGEFSVAFNAMIDALREKQAAEEQVRYLSMHDTLTGLYNRTYFTEEMARLERGRSFPVSILLADLDDLKKVNDTRGHAAGDLILQEAALILQKGVRSDDVVARIGGDEFVVILPETDVNDAARVLERIRAVEADYNAGSVEFSIAMSVGMATAHENGPLEQTLRLADQRMYEDKAARKGLAAGVP